MKEKNILLLILLFIIGLFTINFITIKADSGWDSSYDSGSSWSSSDWGSSSSWDSGSYSSWDNDYSYSGRGSSHSGSPFFTFMLVIIIFIIIICIINGNKKNNYLNNNSPVTTTEDISKKIKALIPDFDENKFLNDTYQLFVDVQNSWMNFDYNKLRNLLTDELYNTYFTQLKVLKAKNQKNIMEAFHLNNHRLASFNISNTELTIKTYLSVAFYDYVVDKNEQVVRGNKYRKIVMTYELTFVRSKVQKENKCPNCHAPLPNNSSNVCEYCRSNIISSSHNWVLSKKQAINQNWER